MNAKQLGLSVVLLDFSGLTAYALYQYGVVGVVELETANAVTVAAFADLVIALSLVVLWMRQDAAVVQMKELSLVIHIALRPQELEDVDILAGILIAALVVFIAGPEPHLCVFVLLPP